MAELIAKLNDLFGADTTDQNKLVFYDGVLGSVAESEKLRAQAQNNTKMQLAISPDLQPEFENAVMASVDAFSSLSRQTLNSPVVMRALIDYAIDHSNLYERLREQRAA